MKFNNATEMLSCLQDGTDLYSPEAEIYVFVYNNRGAIAYYNISKERVSELAGMAREYEDYWGAFLGIGGWIIEPEDEDYEYFDDPTGTEIENWIEYEWEDTDTYY